MPSVLTPVTVVAPSGVDGRGGTATLNNSADSNFVGYLFKPTGFGGAGLRLSKDPIPEGHGAIFGSSWWTERSFTFEVQVAQAATTALTDARFQKLCRAFNAMSADGTLSWVDAGAVPKFVLFRLENGPSDPDPIDSHVLVGCSASDPRIYSTGGTSSASTSHSITNAGNTDSPGWSVTIASPSATCVITNSTTGQTFTFTGLSGGGTVTVNFRTKTITQGGVSKLSAVTWPSSSWLTLAPGANSLTCTNAMAVAWDNAWSSS